MSSRTENKLSVGSSRGMTPDSADHRVSQRTGSLWFDQCQVSGPEARVLDRPTRKGCRYADLGASRGTGSTIRSHAAATCVSSSPDALMACRSIRIIMDNESGDASPLYRAEK